LDANHRRQEHQGIGERAYFLVSLLPRDTADVLIGIVTLKPLAHFSTLSNHSSSSVRTGVTQVDFRGSLVVIFAGTLSQARLVDATQLGIELHELGHPRAYLQTLRCGGAPTHKLFGPVVQARHAQDFYVVHMEREGCVLMLPISEWSR
jgi:hypothetical protein